MPRTAQADARLQCALPEVERLRRTLAAVRLAVPDEQQGRVLQILGYDTRGVAKI
jgi:hypothetical protein